jgi:hypothetical protein
MKGFGFNPKFDFDFYPVYPVHPCKKKGLCLLSGSGFAGVSYQCRFLQSGQIHGG